MKIIHFEEAEQKDYAPTARRGTVGRVVIGKADGAANFCMRVFTLAAGACSSDHAHGFEHEVFVHAGKGAIRKDGEWVDLGAGSVVFIAPNEKHQLKNTGEQPFIFVCAIPAGVPEI